MSTEPRNYAGTKDWFGKDSDRRKKIIDAVTQVLRTYGFESLETPVIELAEVLKGKYGEEGGQQTYFFKKGGTDLGLRYDQTVPLARVVAQYPDLTLPYRRFAIGPVFRADKPQAGRFRQFTQMDFDIVGINSLIADAEVCAINSDILTKLGFEDFQIQICDRRLLNSMAKVIGAETAEQILSILRSWDKIEKASMDQIAEELKEAEISQEIISNFNQMTQKMTQLSGSNNEILLGIEKIFNNEDVTKDVDILRTLIGYIDDFGVPSKNFKVNPCLARGLSYYTGPIFETIIGSGIGSVTGGGRFDNLIETLGGPSIPATGSSFGLERILGVMDQLNMNENETNQIDVFVTVFDPNSQKFIKEAVQIATLLRSNKFKTEISMGQEKLGKQLKLADRRGAKFAVIVGPEEMESGNVVVKKLAELAGGSKENQVVVKKNQLIEALGGLIN